MEKITIAVIGLGYVGLPLATEFSKYFHVIGYDIDCEHIRDLNKGYDKTGELSSDALMDKDNKLTFTDNPANLINANIFIVTVPTPIDQFKTPDLGHLKSASELVAGVLKNNDTVIYESTVYPGATEEVCIPILEKKSGLRLNKEFSVGYSPERMNPGDPSKSVKNIKKLVSASNDDALNFIHDLYAKIVNVGIFKVNSIRNAEAAKVIENIQRDVNIALINELTILFERLGINTQEVLEAARTKWNFIDFRPGFVGGHCIGVDPYYLTYKANQVGFHPELILAGRRVNDSMAEYAALKVVRNLSNNNKATNNLSVLIMGFSFKENCNDIRNTKIIDMINVFKNYGYSVSIYDPVVDAELVYREYGFSLIKEPLPNKYDAVVLAVAHTIFREMPESVYKAMLTNSGLIFDFKGVLPKHLVNYYL